MDINNTSNQLNFEERCAAIFLSDQTLYFQLAYNKTFGKNPQSHSYTLATKKNVVGTPYQRHKTTWNNALAPNENTLSTPEQSSKLTRNTLATA